MSSAARPGCKGPRAGRGSASSKGRDTLCKFTVLELQQITHSLITVFITCLRWWFRELK